MTNQIQLTAENIQQVLGDTSQEKLVVLSFYSAQSPECQEQASILQGIAQQYQQHLVVATLDCDTQQALAGQLAQQIGLQALPTLVLLKEGAPVDMLPGPQSEVQIKEALQKHLPQPQDMLLQQAKDALMVQNHNEAFKLAKQAYDIDSNNSRIKLVLADICIQIHKLDDAKALLETIGLVEQDAYYNNIKAKLELAEQAQDSPEIQALQQTVDDEPENLEAKVNLAVALNEAGKKEDALATLFKVLNKDLNFGDAKKSYLDIIASLPEGDALAAQYRRKLYSILY
ncbi:thioredoxin domain-containing protein EC-YbbN [Pseudoalteromonas sp. SW0106-04]|uniref:tetratricopeptide repeat protein n=1 Tax=Pseudoalteromonas sp. SW0106-04 TaxID=1702169 RepID=UPI0006B58381|nr:tetratricopeptide repeat protein [Pseudoalteromonas sp. SW0106-04]GAP75190.1 thioredoxin domain-containing protein EC-YbbN [Pseudoalteromonas sp. SW0106-04]